MDLQDTSLPSITTRANKYKQSKSGLPSCPRCTCSHAHSNAVPHIKAADAAQHTAKTQHNAKHAQPHLCVRSPAACHMSVCASHSTPHTKCAVPHNTSKTCDDMRLTGRCLWQSPPVTAALFCSPAQAPCAPSQGQHSPPQTWQPCAMQAWAGSHRSHAHGKTLTLVLLRFCSMGAMDSVAYMWRSV